MRRGQCCPSGGEMQGNEVAFGKEDGGLFRWRLLVHDQ
jgi:hypothetical protein